MTISRRDFLRIFGETIAYSLLLPSVNVSAAATNHSNDYKALVCIFLYGGNDGNNMIIPYDQYEDYASVRNTAQNLNIQKSSLLPIKAPSHNNLNFGFHPSMSELQSLYTSGKLAVLCNTGPLNKLIDRQQYLIGTDFPEQLFSHSSQQAEWQSATTSLLDPLANTGWGGRISDTLQTYKLSNKLPVITSFSGNALFNNGQITKPFEPGNRLAGINSSASDSRYRAFRSLLEATGLPTISQAINNKLITAIDNSELYNTAISSSASFKTVFPSGLLATQLLNVAKTIAVRSKLSSQKQIFFVSLNGFDTHTNQLTQQASLLRQISQSMAAFYSAMNELGVENNVTSFTMSDFARTFQPNANGGSDHGWGNHHLILGGAVKGGDFYGKFPSLALAGADDSGNQGRWIPSTSVEQYAGILTGWLGITEKEILRIFPKLSEFSAITPRFL